MVEAFEKTAGHLSLRLMAALDAGQAAGGDKRGMQSAAMLIVKKNGGVWLNNDVVLRLQVDDSPEPLKELRRVVEKWNAAAPPAISNSVNCVLAPDLSFMLLCARNSRPMFRLAVPVVLAELGWMTMGMVDTLMVGPLGPEAIGAVGVGSSLFMGVVIFAMGLMLGLDTLVSQAFGAGPARRVPPVAGARRRR